MSHANVCKLDLFELVLRSFTVRQEQDKLNESPQVTSLLRMGSLNEQIIVLH